MNKTYTQKEKGLTRILLPLESVHPCVSDSTSLRLRQHLHQRNSNKSDSNQAQGMLVFWSSHLWTLSVTTTRLAQNNRKRRMHDLSKACNFTPMPTECRKCSHRET